MLKQLARLMFVLLAVTIALPVAQVAARPMHAATPMTPECAMADGCCDAGELCAMTCADRCLMVLPAEPLSSNHVVEPALRIARASAVLIPHTHAPEPPVPRAC